MDESTKGRPPKPEKVEQVTRAGRRLDGEGQSSVSPTSIARRTETPAYIVYNRDVGVLQNDLRDEIADIREKDHFVRDILMRLEKLSDLSETERETVIADVGELVTKAFRYCRAELTVEKAKQNPKTFWELISKLLIKLLPDSLKLETSSETEQLLGHLEQIRDVLSVEAERIVQKRQDQERAKLYGELQRSDRDFLHLVQYLENVNRRLEEQSSKAILIKDLMEQNYHVAQKEKEYPRWGSHVIELVEKFFIDKDKEAARYKNLSRELHGIHAGPATMLTSKERIIAEIDRELERLAESQKVYSTQVTHALEVALQKKKISS